MRRDGASYLRYGFQSRQNGRSLSGAHYGTDNYLQSQPLEEISGHYCPDIRITEMRSPNSHTEVINGHIVLDFR